MKKKENILEQVGRNTGYKVPEGYFEQFTARMTEQLPERDLPKPEVVTTWHKLRPYLYMAAMFAGIWLMLQVFVAPVVEADKELTAVSPLRPFGPPPLKGRFWCVSRFYEHLPEMLSHLRDENS